MKNVITELLACLLFAILVLFFFVGVRINGKTYGVTRDDGQPPLEIKWGQP